jgi:hypothetical protein
VLTDARDRCFSFSSSKDHTTTFVNSDRSEDGEYGRELVEAPLEPYDISESKLFNCKSAEFIYRFNVTNLIADNMAKYQMFRGDTCDIDITSNTYMVPHLVFDETPIGSGTVTRQIGFLLIPDAETLKDSAIYTTNAAGSVATIHFCIRLALYTTDGSILVNFRDVDVVIKKYFQDGFRRNLLGRRRRLASGATLVDCSEGYDVLFDYDPSAVIIDDGSETGGNSTNSTGGNSTNSTEEPVSTAEDDATDAPGGLFGGIAVNPDSILPSFGANGTDKSAVDAFFVDSYECGSDNQPIDPDTSPRSQGSMYRVCVQTNEQAASLGLYMRSIHSFIFSKQDEGFPLVTQTAVVGGGPDAYGLTNLVCESGNSLCSFETLLKAEFYYTSGIVLGSGLATLQFGSSSQRRDLLLASKINMPPPRSLQQTRDPSSSSYGFDDIQIEVISVIDQFREAEAQDQHTYLVGCFAFIVVIFVNLSALGFIRYTRRAVARHAADELKEGNILPHSQNYGGFEDHHDNESVGAGTNEKDMMA